jgi:hypothetical protein
MKNISVTDIRPFVRWMDPDTNKVSISALGTSAQIRLDEWSYMRTTQTASLFIDDVLISTINLPRSTGRLARPPLFEVPVDKYFQAGRTYAVYIIIVEPDGSPTPNTSKSKTLTITITA